MVYYAFINTKVAGMLIPAMDSMGGYSLCSPHGEASGGEGIRTKLPFENSFIEAGYSIIEVVGILGPIRLVCVD
ncbi:MAG TPA: hypothetical protein VGE97_02015 [Nitrososphaera sp.]|jgi:hypothetical protein